MDRYCEASIAILLDWTKVRLVYYVGSNAPARNTRRFSGGNNVIKGIVDIGCLLTIFIKVQYTKVLPELSCLLRNVWDGAKLCTAVLKRYVFRLVVTVYSWQQAC